MGIKRCVVAGVLVACAGVGASALANDAHDRVLGLDAAARNNLFQEVIAGTNADCSLVTQTFYQGMDRKNTAFWNARCKEGDYVVAISANETGSTRVLSCAMLKRAKGGKCFTKF